jgi:hypothetical protein
MEIRLSETFTGDIDGESPVRALPVLPDDKSASLVSVQRFRGRLGGLEGDFGKGSDGWLDYWFE